MSKTRTAIFIYISFCMRGQQGEGIDSVPSKPDDTGILLNMVL